MNLLKIIALVAISWIVAFVSAVGVAIGYVASPLICGCYAGFVIGCEHIELLFSRLYGVGFTLWRRDRNRKGSEG